MMHYYTVKFTAGKASKQMGAKSELSLEDFKDQVQRQLDAKKNADEARRKLPPAERSKAVEKLFFGYSGKIDGLAIEESEEVKAPPVNSPIKKLVPNA